MSRHTSSLRSTSRNPDDKQEIEPALAQLAQLPEALGQAEAILADTGYFSEANVERCEEARIVPLIAQRREQHNLPLAQRCQDDPEPP